MTLGNVLSAVWESLVFRALQPGLWLTPVKENYSNLRQLESCFLHQVWKGVEWDSLDPFPYIRSRSVLGQPTQELQLLFPVATP